MRLAITLVALILVGITVLWSGTDGFRAFTAEQARRLAVLDQPVILPGFKLRDHNRRELRLGDYQGSVVLVDFIYSRCKTWCLFMSSRFQTLHKQLGQDAEIELLSVSFDPQDRNPGVLSGYADRFGADGERWRLASISQPSPPEALLTAFGVVVIPDGQGGFQHNAAIHILDRQGRLRRIIDFDAPTAAIFQAIESL